MLQAKNNVLNLKSPAAAARTARLDLTINV